MKAIGIISILPGVDSKADTRRIANKPLFSYAEDAMLKSNLNMMVVSTESREVGDMAINYASAYEGETFEKFEGHERKPSIKNGPDFILESLQDYFKHNSWQAKKHEYTLVLNAKAAFITETDINAALEKIEASQRPGLIAVTVPFSQPSSFVSVNGNNASYLFKHEEKALIDTRVFYLINTRHLLENATFITEDPDYIEVDPLNAILIDNDSAAALADAWYKEKKAERLRTKEKQTT